MQVPVTWLLANGGIVGAGLVAVGWGALESVSRQTKRMPLGALGWVLLRLVADFAVGMLAYPVAQAASGPGLSQVVVAVLAGTGGSALLRSYVVAVGKTKEATQVGLVYPYNRLVELTTGRIDDISSRAEADWVWNRVIPALARLSLQDLSEQTKTYIQGLQRLKRPDRDDIVAFIDGTVASVEALDGPAQERACRNAKTAIVHLLLKHGGSGFVSDLTRRVHLAPA
jgi:hypothetical protein